MNNDIILVSEQEQSLLMVPVQAVEEDLVTKTDYIIYTPVATETSYGVVKIGSGFINSNGEISVLIDDKLSSTSINPVQNKVVFERLTEIVGDIPTKTSQLENDGDGISPFTTKQYIDEYGVGKISAIYVNGVLQEIDADKNVYLVVPVKTSDLINDGDGTSPFATEEYVEQNGGKIDSISVDGVEQNIDENKNVNIRLEDYAKTEYVDERFDGANKAVSFINYSSMISSLNALNNTAYNVGQNIMIVTLTVPDLWVSEIAETSVDYTYVSDDEFVNDLNTNGSVQVGYYKLSALETQKVDLTDYVKNTDYATSSKGGVIKTSSYGGILVGGDGVAYISPASNANIDAKTAGVNKPIVPANLDYAVKVGLTTNTQEFTADDKKAARDLIGAVGNEDYATQTKAGVLKLGTSATGLQYDTSGYLKIMRASETDINNKADAYKPIVPMHLDYAVKQGLADSKLEWTEEEKAMAKETLGVKDNPYVKVNSTITGASAVGLNSIAIGSNASTKGQDSISIGSYSKAETTGNANIAIGSEAKATGSNSIQIGRGTNSTNNTVQFGSSSRPINSLSIYQDATNAINGEAGYKELATKEYVDSVSGEVSIDNTTITKNTNDEMQAVGLTDGVNTLTFAEIYEALTIEED